MGPMAIIAGVGLAVSAVGAYSSHKQQKKARKAMKRSAAAQRAQDNMKAARERREAIRNARLASGASLQGAVNQGAENSSASLGALGSIEQQLNQGLSFLDGQNRLADQAAHYIGKAQDYSAKADTWSAVSGLGMQVFKSASGIAQVFAGGGGGAAGAAGAGAGAG